MSETIPSAVATVKHDKKINAWGCFAGRKVGRLYLVEGILEPFQSHDIFEHKMLPSADDIFGHDAERTKLVLSAG